MFKKVLLATFLSTAAVFAGKIQVLNQDSFKSETQSGTVLVDFYGEWCGPCKRIAPVLELVEEDMKGQVRIYKVDIDKSRDLANSYDVQGVPTLILLKNGKEKGRLVGFHDKSAIKKFIEKN